jgi:hypothetical protein
MSKRSKIVLMCHRHKLLDPISNKGNSLNLSSVATHLAYPYPIKNLVCRKKSRGIHWSSQWRKVDLLLESAFVLWDSLQMVNSKTIPYTLRINNWVSKQVDMSIVTVTHSTLHISVAWLSGSIKIPEFLYFVIFPYKAYKHCCYVNVELVFLNIYILPYMCTGNMNSVTNVSY